MSSLQRKSWLTAAREACSMSRIHLLMLSIDESHSRWPGALSLRMTENRGRAEKKKCHETKWEKMKDDIWSRQKEDVHTGKKGTDVSVTKTDDCIDKSGTSWRPLPTCLIFVPVRSAEPLPVGSHHQRATSCQEAKLALKPQSALQQRPHGPSDFS